MDCNKFKSLATNYKDVNIKEKNNESIRAVISHDGRNIKNGNTHTRRCSSAGNALIGNYIGPVVKEVTIQTKKCMVRRIYLLVKF